jgi:hypothetical protein
MYHTFFSYVPSQIFNIHEIVSYLFWWFSFRRSPLYDIEDGTGELDDVESIKTKETHFPENVCVDKNN